MSCANTVVVFVTIKMDINKGKIRIKDIAERANVSTGTVDRVLHNRGEVKEETRKKVMDIVKEMEYTPNLLAKSLALKKTFRIAAVIPAISANNPYWEKPLEGIRKGAKEISDYNTAVDIYTFNAGDEQSYKKVLQTVLKAQPEGVILNPVFKETSLEFTVSLDEANIPYVYIDVNLEKGNNLAYFGQNAKQSGKVAAKIMHRVLPEGSLILVPKLTNHKVISTHLQRREEGFVEYFDESDKKNCNFISVKIDLLEKNEPQKTLQKVFADNPDIKAVFVPNSRVFRVAEFMRGQGREDLFLLGFDLINKNIKFLNEEVIDFLISQKPEEQGRNGVMALFEHLVMGKKMQPINHSPIDIIVKENIEYYK